MSQNQLTTETPATELLGELFQHVDRLGRQQLALLRAEVAEKLDAGVTTATDAGVGVALLAASGALTTAAAVHFLHRMTKLPLWCCYALAAGAAGFGGVQLLARAKQNAAGLASLPQTTAGLKENVQWLRRHVSR